MSKNCHANRCIQCNVASCKNHCGEENFCSLDCVSIGTHEGDPAMNRCTDCLSFVNIDRNEQRSAIDRSRSMNENRTNY